MAQVNDEPMRIVHVLRAQRSEHPLAIAIEIASDDLRRRSWPAEGRGASGAAGVSSGGAAADGLAVPPCAQARATGSNQGHRCQGTMQINA